MGHTSGLYTLKSRIKKPAVCPDVWVKLLAGAMSSADVDNSVYLSALQEKDRVGTEVLHSLPKYSDPRVRSAEQWEGGRHALARIHCTGSED